MNDLALFAGAGGGLLATQWLLGWRTVCYVEKDPYCQKIIQARIADGLLDNAPLWDDVCTFDGKPWRGVVDCITAGFPCQPFSGAGNGLAELDSRNLWPDTLRIVREVRPEWIFLENVSRLLSLDYVRAVFGDLAESGFDCRWDCIPASAVGAPHRRDRVWVVAHARGERYTTTIQHFPRRSAETKLGGHGKVRVMANANDSGYILHKRSQQEKIQERDDVERGGNEICDADRDRMEKQANIEPRFRIGQNDWWSVEPDVDRVADGVASRVDRIRALGNGQVSAVVASAWYLLGGVLS